MTNISFYHLTCHTLCEALPKLMERAYAAKLKVVVRAATDARVQELDRALWAYDNASFLPHGTDRNEQLDLQPIFITTKTEIPNAATVITLVDNRVDDDIKNFDRCLYLFDGNDPQAVTTAREHWKMFKSEDHQLTYWQQADTGGWQKQG